MATRDEILQSRALRLQQRRPAGVASVSDAIAVIEVVVGASRYALPSSSVREVVARPTITPLPDLLPHIIGIASVRGDLLGLVDLGVFFGGPPIRDGRVVVVTDRRGPVGLLVDAVDGFESVGRSTLGPSTRAAFIVGVTPDGLHLVDVDGLVRASAATSTPGPR